VRTDDQKIKVRVTITPVFTVTSLTSDGADEEKIGTVEYMHEQWQFQADSNAWPLQPQELEALAAEIRKIDERYPTGTVE
jgi:hypothetical protein